MFVTYRLSVRLGEHNLLSDEDCLPDDATICADPVQDIPVANSVGHTNYNTPKWANDIGLIRLSTKAQLNGEF